MIVWLDNHLSPALARWVTSEFRHACLVVRELELARASDGTIFERAREAGAVFMTNDRDFAELIDRRGPPPHIVLLTCGDTSTAHLSTILKTRLPAALALIERGEPLVEIGGDA